MGVGASVLGVSHDPPDTESFYGADGRTPYSPTKRYALLLELCKVPSVRQDVPSLRL